MVGDVTLAMQKFVFDVERQRFPDLSDDDVWLRLAVRRLGEDVVRKVYGRVP